MRRNLDEIGLGLIYLSQCFVLLFKLNSAFLQAGGHFVEPICKSFDLIPRVNVRPLIEVAAGDRLGGIHQRIKRHNNHPCHHHANNNHQQHQNSEDDGVGRPAL